MTKIGTLYIIRIDDYMIEVVSMISYNNSDVIQCLRQYEMFANSLNLVRNKEQREMIIKQLTKLEEKIINLTNEIYEEEYETLANKQCGLFADEKNRVNMLIELINQRLSYVEKRCNDHYELTGESINAIEVRGANQLDELESRVKIIDKYIKNTKLKQELNDEVKSLTSKIELASKKIDINKSLNVELETTFKNTINDAINRLDLNKLTLLKDDIKYAYDETEKSLTLAGINLEMAKTSPVNILADCQEMYNEVLKDYDKYRDQMCTLKLMEVYDKDVNDYSSLLSKRKMVNEIVNYINNQELLDLIMDVISKQYNTIVMEGQDINTYNDLVLEKDRKLEALKEIDEENNSDKFQSVLKELIENERKKQEKILEEQRKIEEEEKKRKLEIERKKQEEILKRQRIIEEARKKEIEKRTKQMLEEQQNSVLQGKKQEKVVTFETIKDDSLEKARQEEEKKSELETRETRYNLNINDLKNSEKEVPSKNKLDIEKELFAEFNSQVDTKKNESKMPGEAVMTPEVQEQPVKDDILKENDGIAFFDREVIENKDTSLNDNKFPDMSIDEYMKNFDEKKVTNTSDLFSDDVFPSIPM